MPRQQLASQEPSTKASEGTGAGGGSRRRAGVQDIDRADKVYNVEWLRRPARQVDKIGAREVKNFMPTSMYAQSRTAQMLSSLILCYNGVLEHVACTKRAEQHKFTHNA